MIEPQLSLVTGTRDRPYELRRLIASIHERTSVPWELIVADASTEPESEAGLPWQVIMLPERPRLGMTRGYNRAFQQARGEWVIWLNDDAEVMPGYDLAAIRFMEAHPEVGLGALQFAEPDRSDWHVMHCLYGMLYANFGIIRRALGEQVGWFDEEIEMYGSDNSLTYRVLLAGRGVAEIPDARIYHYETKDAVRQANQIERDREARVLKQKYGPLLDEMRAVHDRVQQGLCAAQ